MRESLDLFAMPLADVAAEGLVLRAVGPAPRVALLRSSDQSVSLSPGVYAFELELRGGGGCVKPVLVCSGPSGVRETVLDAVSEIEWSAAPIFSHMTTKLELRLNAVEGEFVVARCRISTECFDPALSLRSALRQVGRALYFGSPRWLRRVVSKAVVLRSNERVAMAPPESAADGGRIHVVNSDSIDAAELVARRIDFDERFAVARGLNEASVPQPSLIVRVEKQRARVVAFYLPQYHRIPENDSWWAPGFTEWTNVAKAVPQFVGHHQPKLPGELGFYDLTSPGMLSRQVALAREGGVSAFCFHYYWFSGRRLLERPLDAFLADQSLDISFTLCWANENWTRKWDGAADAVLIAQAHSAEDHASVFDDMARYLEDPRALRIDGKPLIVVYRPAIIGDATLMAEIWRTRALARGWPGIFIVATDAFGFDDPRSLGFDGLLEFPPHGLASDRVDHGQQWLNRGFGGAVFDYAQTADAAISQLARRTPRRFDHFPGVMPGWDNEARRPGAGTIFHGATPEAYARWLAAACEAAAHTLPRDRRLVFVNAWNEWGEGAYLEPDRKWGTAFLDATAAVMGVG